MIPSVGEPDVPVEAAQQTRSAARLAFRLLLALGLGSLNATGVLAYRHWSYQQRIRRRIAAEEVFYLEYFYLLTYVTILWISINSVLFAMGARVRLIQYNDNLIPKLLFWPVLLMLVFAVSVYTFY